MGQLSVIIQDMVPVFVSTGMLFLFLYYNFHQFSLRLFQVMAGSTALATIAAVMRWGQLSFWFIALHLILGFYLHCLKKAVEMVSFSSQTCVPFNKRVYSMSEFSK
jgi:hypothetical protein